MRAHECYHCKRWIEEGEAHDCWSTSEQALTQDLSEDLLEAWQRLRETAAAFGDQRIYASHHSIMFSRKSCYFFVRPKRSFLEVCVFLRRAVKAPQVRRVDQSSRSKFVHVVRIQHRDQVEPPLSDWLREAYETSELPARPTRRVQGVSRPLSTRGKKNAPAARKKGAAGTATRKGKSGRRQ